MANVNGVPQLVAVMPPHFLLQHDLVFLRLILHHLLILLGREPDEQQLHDVAQHVRVAAAAHRRDEARDVGRREVRAGEEVERRRDQPLRGLAAARGAR